MSEDTTSVLVSPAEPQSIKTEMARRAEMEVSPLPERYGVDFLWRARGTWWGCQRKTVTDLLASLQDGRVTREVGQMVSRVSMPVLIIEGYPKWTVEGVMLSGGWRTPMTRQQWRGMIWSFASVGITVVHSDNAFDTVDSIVSLVHWSNKAKHTSLTARPKAVDSAWGSASNRDWGVHLLQGFDGIGSGVAGDIFDHFGRVPLRWEVGRDDMLAVKGLGPKRVDKLLGALE